MAPRPGIEEERGAAGRRRDALGVRRGRSGVAGATLRRMRTPQEAVSIILTEARAPAQPENCALGEATGRVLASDVHSDLDLPPFEKSAMDGFAVHRSDFEAGDPVAEVRLAVLGESRAGEPFGGPIPPGSCVEIYTGGEVPADCDAVVVVEKSRRDGDSVLLSDTPSPRQNICARGEDLREGDRVLGAGTRLSPSALSVLASVGTDPVPVFPEPRVAILTTGDELVPPSQRPGPGQIREGNTLHLAAMARAAGAHVVRAGIVRDDAAELAETFRAVLDECQVLITTGGVSMGRYDLVGAALEACGVRKIFHKVAIKPGRPIWFGRTESALVFGLPGNPVSCLVGQEVFVRPALAKLGGESEDRWIPPLRRARWKAPSTRRLDRQQNVPVEVRQAEDGVDEIAPVRWKSSADIVGLSRASGLAVIPAETVLSEGDAAYFRPLF